MTERICASSVINGTLVTRGGLCCFLEVASLTSPMRRRNRGAIRSLVTPLVMIMLIGGVMVDLISGNMGNVTGVWVTYCSHHHHYLHPHSGCRMMGVRDQQ